MTTRASLAGATALVTGATSGIGRAVAVSLANLGAHVIVSGDMDVLVNNRARSSTSTVAARQCEESQTSR